MTSSTSEPDPTDATLAVEHERTRIGRVYGDYLQSDEVQRRWDHGNPGNRAILAERRHGLDRVLAPLRSLDAPIVLEVGCGAGTMLADLESLLPPSRVVIGTDLLGERLPLVPEHLPVLQSDGQSLPFRSASIDAAVTATVFSSILDDRVAHALAREIDRVLRPGGLLVFYDMRRGNPRNPETRPIGRDALTSLFPGWSQDLTTCTLLPPLARRLGGLTDRLYPILTHVRFLHTHQLGTLEKPLA